MANTSKPFHTCLQFVFLCIQAREVKVAPMDWSLDPQESTEVDPTQASSASLLLCSLVSLVTKTGRFPQLYFIE